MASPATINAHLAAIRSLMRIMRRAQLCHWTLDVVSEKSQAYRDTRGPGLPAVRAMLRAAARQADQRKAARDIAIFRLLNDLGLRRSELLGLDLPNHVERDVGEMPIAIFVRGKGSTSRVRLSLPSKTALALHAWIHERGPNEGPLFISVDPGAGRAGRGGRQRALEERLSGEGVAGFSLHSRLTLTYPRAFDRMDSAIPRSRHSSIMVLVFAKRSASVVTLMRYDDNRTDIAGDMAKRLSDLI